MTYVVHSQPRLNLLEEPGAWLYRSRTPRIVRMLALDEPVVRPRRQLEPEIYENWLYTRIRIGVAAIDAMAAFESNAFVPEPAASQTDQAITGYVNDYTLDVTVSTVTDFDVIVGVGFVQGSQFAPLAALDQAIIFHRPPSKEAVMELVLPLFLELQDVPNQAVVDMIVSEASQAGYSITVVGSVSGNELTQQFETHTISIDQLGIGEALSQWSVVVAPTIDQAGTGLVIESASVIAIAPGETVGVDWAKSWASAVAFATVPVSVMGAMVVSGVSAASGLNPIGPINKPGIRRRGVVRSIEPK